MKCEDCSNYEPKTIIRNVHLGFVNLGYHLRHDGGKWWDILASDSEYVIGSIRMSEEEVKGI